MKNNEDNRQTDAQKYSHDFEELSLQIVRKLLNNTNAEIKKTNRIKDGGYDIVVEYKDNDSVKRVYFECKLRSYNLNLRDISANLIIAFNEGAVGLVVITNYDYTAQMSENISTFYAKTILNIKIIVGEDIKRICKGFNLAIKDELSNIISAKKTNAKNNYKFLRLDLSQSDLWSQIFNKNYLDKKIEDSFVKETYYEEWQRLYKYIKNENTTVLSGLLGVGKTSIIRSVLSAVSNRTIHIIASRYTSQSQLLLSIFLDIWGIPVHSIVQEFSDDIVNRIVEVIEQKHMEKSIGQIIKHLFGKARGISDEHYNALICEYLIHQINTHKPQIKYVFWIENTEKATEEIQVLLVYIVKLLIDNKISCIIEMDDDEYKAAKIYDSSFFSEQIKLMDTYEIPMRYLYPDEAEGFVRKELPHFPRSVQKKILNKGGVRLLTLNILITYVKEIYANDAQYDQIAQKLEFFSPNDLPQPIRLILSFYYKLFPNLFHHLYFFEGRIPIECLDGLVSGYENVIDKLLSLKFLDIDDSHLLVANQLVMEEINNYAKNSRFTLISDAKKMLNRINDTKDIIYIECKIKIYFILKQKDEACRLIFLYMKKLREERQYSSFLKYANIILDKNNYRFTDKQQHIEFLIGLLETWVIKKEINNEKANQLIEQFEELLYYLEADKREKYKTILDYFKSTKYFEQCDFHLSKEITEPYYNMIMNTKPIDDSNEWIANLCVVYALNIKELSGNENAQTVFSNIWDNLPNSFCVQIEYLSHDACMNFYNDPLRSLSDINKIISLYEEEHKENYQLPFHEYVDRAMCAFCAKNYNMGLKFSNEAIRILESNGIMPALGRAYNIKGCIMVCKNNLDEAEHCFNEASLMMKEAQYNLYSWRSRLNLLNLDIIYSRNHIKNTQLRLDETYCQFKEIYKEKLQTLKRDKKFFTSREYFALLMFGQLYKCLGKERTNEIADTFLFENEKSVYKKHLRELCDRRIKNTYFRNCSYAMEKYLFMVG